MKNIYVKATRSKEPKLYRNDQEKKINLYQEINEGISSGDIVTGGGGDDLGNHIATQKLDLATNKLVGEGGTEGIYINSSGEVGIGQAPSATRSLAVSSSILVAQGKAFQTAGFNSEFRDNYIQFYSSAGAKLSSTVDGNLSIGYGASNVTMFLENTGNIGIGTTTPGAKLEVKGTGVSSGIALSLKDSAGTTLANFNNNGSITDLAKGRYTMSTTQFTPNSTYDNIIDLGKTNARFKNIFSYGLDLGGAITQQELSTDPVDPAEGSSVQWKSSGVGSGDSGDIMIKITDGGVTKITTLIDFSTI